jgi:hypothetical protein
VIETVVVSLSKMFGKFEKVTVHLAGLDGIITMRMFNVTEYLADRDYLVRLENKDYGFDAVFPEQCMSYQSSPVVRVQLELDFESELIHSTGFAGGQPQFRNMHEVPRYAMCEFILIYMANVCEEINYDPQLIVYILNGEDVPQTDFLEATMGPNLTGKEIDKGTTLLQLLGAAKAAGYTKEYQAHAESQGVLYGYNVLLQILGEADEETQDFMAR